MSINHSQSDKYTLLNQLCSGDGVNNESCSKTGVDWKDSPLALRDKLRNYLSTTQQIVTAYLLNVARL